MKLCMIGTGYVGLVSGVCFAELGNDVICVDKDIAKINKLKSIIPIYEPGLEELLKKTTSLEDLSFQPILLNQLENQILFLFAWDTNNKE